MPADPALSPLAPALPGPPQRALVTGGGGFLGHAIVARLRAEGHAVRSLARGRYPEVEALGAEQVQHDLADPAGLQAHLDGVDVVFHAASRTGVWGSREAFFRANVDGTRHLLEAARAAGVRRFVYTSSPSATFDGRDAEGATEADCPYPTHFHAPYPESKAEAERLVLAANGPALATTALRPHLIWGPRDPHILPRLVSRRRQGRLVRVGPGTNKVGICYIDNAAVAHLQAAAVLQPGSPNAGKAYFLHDPEPVLLWPWIDQLLVAVGLPPVQRSVSPGVAMALGGLLEWVWRTFQRPGEPPMTRFVAAELASSHWYDLSAARRDFGYAPVVGPDEGLRRAVAWLKANPPAAV
jgi:nucleoside-diphosphate-sugar epimerase